MEGRPAFPAILLVNALHCRNFINAVFPCVPLFSDVSVLVLYEFLEICFYFCSASASPQKQKDRSCRNWSSFSLLVVCCSQGQNKAFQNRRLILSDRQTGIVILTNISRYRKLIRNNSHLIIIFLLQIRKNINNTIVLLILLHAASKVNDITRKHEVLFRVTSFGHYRSLEGG